MKKVWVLFGLLLSLMIPAAAQDSAYSRKEDVIYGRKFGTALTMDVFTPKANPNGAGIVFCVSGGWFSSHDNINPGFTAEFIKRGYTVFAVVHGSQPKFTIPEVLQDMHRALRFIRFRAKEYGVDPDRIGIAGGSAGGHLSLMQGTAGAVGDEKARDPIDRVSSRVQAVACFFPPTDFLNYGESGRGAVAIADTWKDSTLKDFRAPFDFTEWSTSEKIFVKITDEKRIQDIARQISPIYHITKETPPTLIVHGDADKLVPIQQAQSFIDKLKATGVPAELVVKKGAGHGWPTLTQDISVLADWFDKYLKKI